MIQAADLIAKFQYALDGNWGYIWGKTHEMWSEAKQAAYVRAYHDDKRRANSVQYGGRWAGHWVTDCSGLFAWAFNELGGYMYHGSNTMYDKYCQQHGTLKKGLRSDGKPLLPGSAVFTGDGGNKGHVGLFCGNGKVIEAAGTKQGVIVSSVTDKKWTFWGELKDVEYGDGGGAMPDIKPAEGEAIVTGVRVALREGPSTKSKVLTRIDTGETVHKEASPDGWEYVTANGKSGFMMKEFLRD